MEDIIMIPCESSNIAQYGYDLPSKTLAMQFKNKDGEPGPKYRYSDVPLEKYAGMTAAESVGRYFYAEIKGKYACQKVGD